MPEQIEPPVFVRGGKRLNFDRTDEWTNEVNETFIGSGKSEGCACEATWDELCALAALIVAHPAYIPPEQQPRTDYYPPVIEDRSSASTSQEPS